MQCKLSKYLIIVPVANKEADTVARAIFDNLILVHGPVKILVTDQGTEYVNAVVNELCNKLGTEFRNLTPYHHEAMEAIERSHRTFNEYLRSYLSDESDWEEWIKYFAFCYNITHHSSFDFKFTPIGLIYGRRCNSIEYMFSGQIDSIYNLDNCIWQHSVAIIKI